MAKPHILIVEDDMGIGMTVETLLKNSGYKVTWAKTLSTANEAIDTHETFAAVAVDGCMNKRREFDTDTLIGRMASKKVSSFIVATSGSQELRKEMRELGCTHECPKHEFHNLILRLVPIIT